MKGRDISFRVNDSYYGLVTPDLDDIILRHQEPQYDHLRYHNGLVNEAGETLPYITMRAIFLGQQALDTLAGLGMAEAYLEIPTLATVACYEGDQISRMEKQFKEEQ